MVCIADAAVFWGPDIEQLPPDFRQRHFPHGSTGLMFVVHHGDEIPEFLSGRPWPTLVEAKADAVARLAQGGEIEWRAPTADEQAAVRGVVCVMTFSSRR